MALNYLSNLTVANDQMANQFQVRFANLPGVSNTTLLTLRMSKSVDTPDRQIATYEVEYQGSKYTMLSAKEETDKTLTLSFRLDQNWAIYSALKNWFAYTFNTSSGANSASFTNKAAASPTIFVDTFSKGKTYTKSVKYDYVRITSLKLESFDNTSNESGFVEATFIYSFAEFVTNQSAAIGTAGA